MYTDAPVFHLTPVISLTVRPVNGPSLPHNWQVELQPFQDFIWVGKAVCPMSVLPDVFTCFYMFCFWGLLLDHGLKRRTTEVLKGILLSSHHHRHPWKPRDFYEYSRLARLIQARHLCGAYGYHNMFSDIEIEMCSSGNASHSMVSTTAIIKTIVTPLGYVIESQREWIHQITLSIHVICHFKRATRFEISTMR